MAILDTGQILDWVRQGKEISENVTVVSVIEWPPILQYTGFTGKIYYPQLKDFQLAYDIQERLYLKGKMKGFADLLIASICIRSEETLITKDSDFRDIAQSSQLEIDKSE